uniref:DUF4317 domain-containing protein n=1 Tax=Mediterraneibacter gnavus TaxID=33038 RepID=UPI004029A245
MNKREVLEIRKQFTPANCAITRIAGCYVDHEKIKKMESKSAFLSLPEEDTFKYFDILRKTLSGSVGKNLLNLEFPTKQEMPGGTQEFLMKLRKSKLEDDQLLEEFYDRIIESYDYGENYYIVLIHAMYDIPGKSSDDMEMYDASEEVYEYLLCSICPVSLSKAGLSYHAESNCIHDRIRDWVVGMPDKGFLFPAFNDRSTDIHNALYYTRKSTDLDAGLMDGLFGVTGISADTQKEIFNNLLSDALGDKNSFRTVKRIQEVLLEKLETNTEESPEVGKKDILKILLAEKAPDEAVSEFLEGWDFHIGENDTIRISNIVDEKKISIKSCHADIKVESDRTDLVDTMVVNGRKCLVIAVDDSLEVNGIPVRTIERAENE